MLPSVSSTTGPQFPTFCTNAMSGMPILRDFATICNQNVDVFMKLEAGNLAELYVVSRAVSTFLFSEFERLGRSLLSGTVDMLVAHQDQHQVLVTSLARKFMGHDGTRAWSECLRTHLVSSKKYSTANVADFVAAFESSFMSQEHFHSKVGHLVDKLGWKKCASQISSHFERNTDVDAALAASEKLLNDFTSSAVGQLKELARSRNNPSSPFLATVIDTIFGRSETITWKFRFEQPISVGYNVMVTDTFLIPKSFSVLANLSTFYYGVRCVCGHGSDSATIDEGALSLDELDPFSESDFRVWNRKNQTTILAAVIGQLNSTLERIKNDRDNFKPSHADLLCQARFHLTCGLVVGCAVYEWVVCNGDSVPKRPVGSAAT